MVGRSLAHASLWLLVLARAAFANTLAFPDFSSTTGLVLSHDAIAATTSDGAVVRLVPDEAYKTGFLFAAAPIGITRFSTAFSFRMTGGEGILFAMKPA